MSGSKRTSCGLDFQYIQVPWILTMESSGQFKTIRAGNQCQKGIVESTANWAI
jgi:hypothetical protein